MRVRVRFAKLGKVRWTSHRDVARMWERAFRRDRAARRVHRGVLAPAQGQLRPRPPDRARVGGRVPRHRARPPVPMAAPSRRRTLPALLTPACRSGSTSAASPDRRSAPARSSKRSPPAAGRSRSPSVDVAEARTALVDEALAADELVVTRERKGSGVTDDLRPAILARSTVVETRARRDAWRCGRAGHPAPRRPAQRAAGRPRPRARRRPCAQDAPMDPARRRRRGASRSPLDAPAPARCWSGRHEKGPPCPNQPTGSFARRHADLPLRRRRRRQTPAAPSAAREGAAERRSRRVRLGGDGAAGGRRAAVVAPAVGLGRVRSADGDGSSHRDPPRRGRAGPVR